jgi:hypothetical protein
MTPEAHVQIVLRYFDGCNTGDIEQLKLTLPDDVVHYFLAQVHPAVRGAEHLAKYWRKFKQVYRLYRPTWKIDHTIASGNEVVSEWSCAYTLPSSGSRMMFRGTEWYVIRNHGLQRSEPIISTMKAGIANLTVSPTPIAAISKSNVSLETSSGHSLVSTPKSIGDPSGSGMKASWPWAP